MRTCPTCHKAYPDEAAFCPADGASLIPDDERGRLAGQKLDERYFLEARIGSGGLGEVYRARHVKMGKAVAIKVLGGMAEEVWAARFEREARMLSRLQHPYCVAVTDFGQTEHGPYIVMELIDGVPLSRYTKGAGMPLGQAVELMIDVLAGLEHAHAQGIIHRDLKPDNIMLVPSPTGPAKLQPKILDFGLAMLRTTEGPAGEALTAPGTVVGTPAYMAPERILAAQGAHGMIDVAVDLYAVGVLLFELCCGRRPFVGDHIKELIRQHLTEQPPLPRALRPSLPLALEELLLRCLHKKPEGRYASARELADALRALLPFEPQLATELPPAQPQDSAGASPPGPPAIPPAPPAGAPQRVAAAAPGAVSADSPTRVVSSPPAVLRVADALAGVPQRWLIVGGAALIAVMLAIVIVLAVRC